MRRRTFSREYKIEAVKLVTACDVRARATLDAALVATIGKSFRISDRTYSEARL